MDDIRFGTLLDEVLRAAREADAAGVCPGAPVEVRVTMLEVEMPAYVRIHGRRLTVRLSGTREAPPRGGRFGRLRVSVGTDPAREGA
jgi:hypothetical protein